MARPRMVVMRGNSAPAGKYPDEKGDNIAWPIGALHVDAAKEYAKRRGYEAIVLPVAGQPQYRTSPQATAALDMFHADTGVSAFYGFSGGGYNLWYVLHVLAENTPDELRRIDLVVVLGAPKKGPEEFGPAEYNAIARRTVRPAKWENVGWEVVYRKDPPASAVPDWMPPKTDSHMFGPEFLLTSTPAGRYRDTQFDDEC